MVHQCFLESADKQLWKHSSFTENLLYRLNLALPKKEEKKLLLKKIRIEKRRKP
jgi:hypothetical protein